MSRENLQQYTYEYLMQLALSFVSDDKDKRQGSVIYDALAPFCQVLAAGALQLNNYYTQTYALTATGEDLANRVAEQGITRYSATYAVKRITLQDEVGNPVVALIGSRFATISNTRPVNYTITAQYVDDDGKPVAGSYRATCEETGTIGNEYSGNLINITFIQGLASAYMSTTLEPARDEETDEDLRERYFEALNQKAFGGNISDYKTKVKEEFTGVGAFQIYPTWNGGGTVKLSIVDPQYRPCELDYVKVVQEGMDPENAEGQRGAGLGIAPIGHKVTIVTPDEIPINVSATISLETNYTLGQVEDAVEEALTTYIKSLRASWADSNDLNQYSCNVFVSRVTSAIINVPGIANVVDVKLNGYSNDISLEENKNVQQLPKLNEVTLNVQ